MTGLDRLRMYAQRMDELSVWPGGAKLLDIAGQIEREQGERLMPEGVEWPTCTDGSPVKLGDCVENRHGICTVNSVRFYRGGGVSVYGEGRGAQFVVVTEPVMRDPIRKANPKVLAADGEPLEVGQTVWHVATGSEYTVVGLPKSGEYQAVKLRLDDGAFTGLDPDKLTHQRPVLDADGVPIREGDTVYWLEHTAPFTVVSPHETRDNAGQELECGHTVEVMRDGHELHMYVHPESLHHTKPEIDTWQLIEEDAGCTAAKYNERRGTIFTTKQQVARDLVRRCRALADRERGD